MKLSIGDVVYRSLSQRPYIVVDLDGDKVQIKRGLEPARWVKLKSMEYSYTIAGSDKDKQLRSEWARHNWPIWENCSRCEILKRPEGGHQCGTCGEWI